MDGFGLVLRRRGITAPSSSSVKAAALVCVYLAAIVAANWTLTEYGRAHPEVALYNAFVFIGLDLVTRDSLHDLWRGHVLRNMAVLIAAGSALSYALNRDSGQIALASCVAFGAAAIADALTYQALRDRTWYERVNQSNIAGAGVDSLVFLPLSGIPWTWPLLFSLFCAKVAGGVVWSFVLSRGADGRSWAGRNRERFGK